MEQHTPKVKPKPTEVDLQSLAQIVEAQGALIEHLTRRIDHIQHNGTNKDIHYGPIHGGDLL